MVDYCMCHYYVNKYDLSDAINIEVPSDKKMPSEESREETGTV